MNIENISKEKGEVLVRLSKDDNLSMRILRTIIFRTHLKIPTGFGFISALSGILDAVIHWQNG